MWMKCGVFPHIIKKKVVGKQYKINAIEKFIVDDDELSWVEYDWCQFLINFVCWRPFMSTAEKYSMVMESMMILNIPCLIVLVLCHWERLEFSPTSFVHGQQSTKWIFPFKIYKNMLKLEGLSLPLLIVWLLPDFPILGVVSFVLVAPVNCLRLAAIQLMYRYLLHICERMKEAMKYWFDTSSRWMLN